MTFRSKLVLSVLGLSLVDAVIPIPILGLILVYVIVKQPSWFSRAFRTVYSARQTPA